MHGPPDHWVADTDWKICAENFAGDGYHTPVAHQFGFNLGYFPSSGATHSQGWAAASPARARHRTRAQPELPAFGGFPDELAEEMRRIASSPEQVEVFSQDPYSRRHGLPEPVLPDAAVQPGPGEPGVRFVTMRLVPPDRPGPDGDVLLVPGPEERLPGVQGGGLPGLHPRVRAGRHVRAGRLRELDQGHPLAKSTMVRDIDSRTSWGWRASRTPTSPAPVTSSRPYVNDTNFRNLWTRWGDYLAGEA